MLLEKGNIPITYGRIFIRQSADKVGNLLQLADVYHETPILISFNNIYYLIYIVNDMVTVLPFSYAPPMEQNQ